jgi:hypothetical protein
MIEIDVPTIDPMQHETKIFFGMTSRQCICIVPGVGLGVTLFMLTKSLSIDVAVILLAIAVLPAVCMGWVSPYNMKFEQYVRLLWFNLFISSPKRIYKTDGEEEVKQLTIKERKELEKKQKAQSNSAKLAKKNAKDKNKDNQNKESKKEEL